MNQRLSPSEIGQFMDASRGDPRARPVDTRAALEEVAVETQTPIEVLYAMGEAAGAQTPEQFQQIARRAGQTLGPRFQAGETVDSVVRSFAGDDEQAVTDFMAYARRINQQLYPDDWANQPEPDTSALSALAYGAGEPIRNLGTTLRVLGAGPLGRALEATPQPENYQPAGQSFVNAPEDEFSVGGFAPQYMPRAVVEQAGQVFGSIASRVLGAIGGAAAGAAAGSVIPGVGTVAGGAAGAAAGAFGAPMMFEGLQVFGPLAEARAKADGREAPDQNDLLIAAATAASMGALNAIGARYLPGGVDVDGAMKAIGRSILGEGATEGAQSVVEQTGSTIGTQQGLQIDPRQALGEGLIGGAAGGTATAIAAPFMRRGEQQPGDEQQAAEPPAPGVTGDAPTRGEPRIDWPGGVNAPQDGGDVIDLLDDGDPEQPPVASEIRGEDAMPFSGAPSMVVPPRERDVSTDDERRATVRALVREAEAQFMAESGRSLTVPERRDVIAALEENGGDVASAIVDRLSRDDAEPPASARKTQMETPAQAETPPDLAAVADALDLDNMEPNPLDGVEPTEENARRVLSDVMRGYGANPVGNARMRLWDAIDRGLASPVEVKAYELAAAIERGDAALADEAQARRDERAMMREMEAQFPEDAPFTPEQAPPARGLSVTGAFQPRRGEPPVAVPRSDRGADQQDARRFVEGARTPEQAQPAAGDRGPVPDLRPQQPAAPAPDLRASPVKPPAAAPTAPRVMVNEVGSDGLTDDERAAGKAPLDLVTIKDTYGDTHRVSQRDLNDSKPMLPRFNAKGQRIDGPPLARANIDADGARTTDTWADAPVIGGGRAADQPMKSKTAVRTAISRRGQNVEDFDIREVNGGFIGVRKGADRATTAMVYGVDPGEPAPVAAAAEADPEPTEAQGRPLGSAARLQQDIDRANASMPAGFRLALTGDEANTLAIFAPDGSIEQSLADNFSRLSSTSQAKLLRRGQNIARNKAAQGQSQKPAVPIFDDRREARKRQAREDGKRAALANEEREPPSWMAGDGGEDFRDAWLTGYGEGIAARPKPAADQTPVKNETPAAPEASAPEAAPEGESVKSTAELLAEKIAARRAAAAAQEAAQAPDAAPPSGVRDGEEVGAMLGDREARQIAARWREAVLKIAKDAPEGWRIDLVDSSNGIREVVARDPSGKETQRIVVASQEQAENVARAMVAQAKQPRSALADPNARVVLVDGSTGASRPLVTTPPKRTAAQAGASAASNAGKGAVNFVQGINALFGGKNPNRLNSGFTFDEDTYAQAKPFFRQAFIEFGQAVRDASEALDAIIDFMLGRGVTLDAVEEASPYITRYVDDLLAGVETLEEGKSDGELSGVGEAPQPGTGGGLAPGEQGREGTDRALEGASPEDGGPVSGGGDTGAGGARPDPAPTGGGEGDDGGGDALPGRTGAIDGGMAADGAGDRRPSATRPNYLLADPEAIAGGGPKAKFRRNQRAPLAPIRPAQARAATAAVNREVERAGLGARVTGRVVEGLLGALGQPILGRATGAAIEVDAAAADPAGVARHEIVHVLRDSALWGKPYGLFAQEEWRSLVRAARADAALMESVAAAYPDLNEAGRIEEAVAEMYREWAQGREGRGALARLFERMRDFFRAVGAALRGEGLNDAADVMKRMERGEIGRRSTPRMPASRRVDIGAEGASRELRFLNRLPRARDEAAVDANERTIIDRLSKAASNALTDAMGGVSPRYNLLALVPGRALFQELGKALPSANAYLRTKEEMDALRNEWHAETDRVARAWQEAITKTSGATLLTRGKAKAAAKALADLMHDATTAGLDPAERFKAPRRQPDMRDEDYTRYVDEMRRRYGELRERWNALPEPLQETYRTVRDTFKRMADDVETAVAEAAAAAMDLQAERARARLDDEIRQLRDDGMTGKALADAEEAARRRFKGEIAAMDASRAARIRALRLKFEQNRVEDPYFPLMRWGNYFVTVRDEDGKVVSFSKFERAAKQEAFAAEMRAEGFKVEIGVMGRQTDFSRYVDPNFVADVQEMLGGDPAAGGVMDAIWQRWLETLPDYSIRKSRIHRKGTPGYDGDALRAFAHQMFHGAHQLARIKHGMGLTAHLEQAAREAAAADDPNRATLVVNEMQQRHEWTMNPQGSPWAAAATSAAFIWYLGVSPAAAMVNLSQTTIVGIPILTAGIEGATVGKTARHLGRALRDFASGKGWAETSKRLTDDERAAMREAYERGVLDKSQAHDLASVAESGVEYSGTRERVMRPIAYFFHHAERMNREITFLAAYRMAREAGMDPDAAFRKGADLTWKAHFDYTSSSRPRFMQGDVGKVLFVFRQFNVNMIYRLWRDTHQAIHGADEATRKEARAQLIGITASMMLHAGITGTWGYALLMTVLGLFFEGGSGEAEEELKRGIVETFGPAAGILLKGVPGHLTGVDLSSRIGMPELWFRSPDRQLEGQEAYQFWLEQAVGAVPGIAAGMFRGVQWASEGDVWRGIETAGPKFLRDQMRSIRYLQEGVTTRSGEPVVEDLTPQQALAQAIGFTPAEVAERFEMNRRMRNMEDRIATERRKALRAAYDDLKDGGQISERTMERIQRFNERNPTWIITGDSIRQSIRSRIRMNEQMDSGLRITPKLDGAIRSQMAPALYG